MQTTSQAWETLFLGPHKTEYRFDIAGVTYLGKDIKDTPVIIKRLLDKPALGRVCTGALKLSVYPKGDIPKAATVNAYCRLLSTDGTTSTDWIPQGKYYVSTRSGKKVITLNCLDYMIKTGVTYLDKSAFTEWPVSMEAVVSEICRIMGVSLDSRTTIHTDDIYTVDYPNDDILISEILGMVAAAHGGNWIMTESGKLRLVPFSSPSMSVQNLGRSHMGYTSKGTVQTVSRIILTDSADNDFTAGDDTGITLSVKCDYATQEIVNRLCAVTSQSASALYGVTYEPYTLDNAYLNPAVELGDTLSVMDREGNIHIVVIQSITVNCTVAYTCALTAGTDDETEDEYPYITMQDLSLSRTLKTNQTYYGNRITRKDGFVSELIVNDTPKARLTANAAVFSMQSIDDNGQWVDRIYFDTQTGKYVITADVTVNGAVTVEDLSTSGRTTIIGDNITTGILKSKNGKVQLNLDDGTFTVNGENVEDAITNRDSTITLTASAQMFTKADGATAFTPNKITLTAESVKHHESYKWYKDDTLISTTVSRLFNVTSEDISGTSATFKVVGTDEAGNTHSDIITIAKLTDGRSGEDGTPGAKGEPGKDGSPGTNGADGYTVLLSNEYIEIPVNTSRKPIETSTTACTVSVYKGLTALTATLNKAVGNGQFKVSVVNSISGITVSQTKAGTLQVSVSPETAIFDSSTIELSITVYGGLVLSSSIVVHANMNGVTIQQQASIEVNAQSIIQKVSKGSIISEINQSAEQITISASKLDLNGYVTINSLKNGTTVIDGGCITTGSISANRISGGTLDASQITVSNLSATSIKSGTLSASLISGGTLDASKITVLNLNASSITSGTISADRIDTSTIRVQKLYTSAYQIALMASGSQYLYIGGDGTWNVSYIHLYADQAIRIVPILTSSTSDLLFDTSSLSALSIHSASNNSWDLGSILYYFKNAYITDMNLANSCKIGTTNNNWKITNEAILPSSNSSSHFNIGSSSYPIQNLYATKIYLNGVALTASGTRINTLYAGSSSSSIQLNDSRALVPSTSDFVIGTKASPFQKLYIGSSLYYWEISNTGIVPSSKAVDYFDVGSASYPIQTLYAKTIYLDGTELSLSSGNTDKLYAGTSTTNYIQLNTSKVFLPSGTGFGIGSTTYPFESIYVGTSTYHWKITNGAIIPSSTSASYFNIGSSSAPIQNLYAKKIYLNGSELKPTNDMSGVEVKMGGTSSYYVLCNASRELRPYSSSTSYPAYLGTSSIYWHYAYIGSNTVMIGSSTGSKLGFFGTAAIAKQTLSTTYNNMGYSNATSSNYLYILNNLVGILKNKYGLIS